MNGIPKKKLASCTLWEQGDDISRTNGPSIALQKRKFEKLELPVSSKLMSILLTVPFLIQEEDTPNVSVLYAHKSFFWLKLFLVQTFPWSFALSPTGLQTVIVPNCKMSHLTDQLPNFHLCWRESCCSKELYQEFLNKEGQRKAPCLSTNSSSACNGQPQASSRHIPWYGLTE